MYDLDIIVVAKQQYLAELKEQDAIEDISCKMYCRDYYV